MTLEKRKKHIIENWDLLSESTRDLLQGIGVSPEEQK